MPSTVNKRCVVYISAKRVRSQTVSLMFLLILLNKGFNMLNNTKKSTMILQLMKYLYAHDVIDDLPLSVIGGCNFGKKLVPKPRYGTL